MRTLNKNKQKMYYALLIGVQEDYELDEQGRLIPIYTDPSGVVHYRKSGSKVEVYSTPTRFIANISGNLSEAHAKEYGVDQTSLYSEINCDKGYLPLVYGAKVWKNSPIVWKDADHTIPDVTSADYTVTGVLDEFIDEDWFLLQRVTK